MAKAAYLILLGAFYMNELDQQFKTSWAKIARTSLTATKPNGLKAKTERVKPNGQKANPIEWRPIAHRPGWQVSNSGQVKKRNGQIKEPFLLRQGYLSIGWEGGDRLHRVIATAFIPNPDNKPYVDHIDGDKLNNDISNLRWATPSENTTNWHKNRRTAKPERVSQADTRTL